MIRIRDGDIYLTSLQTRFPFRYGIAEMTNVPHLFLQLEVEADRQTVFGVAADSLPPHWFTKDPAATYEEEIADMLEVIQAACQHAILAGRQVSLFDLWWETYHLQQNWAEDTPYPPLLWNFGVSLVERAMMDAFCKRHALPFASAVHHPAFGFSPARIYPALNRIPVAGLLPSNPRREMLIRHTIGLADPLVPGDIPPEKQLADGLPHSLEENIRAYGLRAFKIKLTGDAAGDLERLVRIASVLEANCPDGYLFTLDGNEQYTSADRFRSFWEALCRHQTLDGFLKKLFVVEQPLHRDRALAPDTGDDLLAWAERPPMIIDESDGSLDSLPIALRSGYTGTSHKNCKGVFKGLANACLLAHLRQQHPQERFDMTGEDLANVGPVALLQDLAVMSALGLEHVERNGHHYFAGLSMFPENWQQEVLAAHPDLYTVTDAGFAALQIRSGRIRLDSVLQAPFGWGGNLDFTDAQDVMRLDDTPDGYPTKQTRKPETAGPGIFPAGTSASNP